MIYAIALSSFVVGWLACLIVASTITMRLRRSSGLGTLKLQPLVVRHNGSFRFGNGAKLSEESVLATRS